MMRPYSNYFIQARLLQTMHFNLGNEVIGLRLHSIIIDIRSTARELARHTIRSPIAFRPSHEWNAGYANMCESCGMYERAVEKQQEHASRMRFWYRKHQHKSTRAQRSSMTQHLCYNSPKIYLSVGVSKLQVAIFARSSRETTLTVRIV